MVLKNSWVMEEIKGEAKITWKQMKMKIWAIRTYGCNKSCTEWEVHSNAGLHQETRKSLNNLSPEETRKMRTNETTASIRKERKRIRGKIIEREI